MKKQFFLVTGALFLLISFSSCFRNHNTSVSILDNEDVYRMTAKFDSYKTNEIRHYLNAHLHSHGYRSFENRQMDDEVTLNDGTSFYLLCRPGRLKIKFDKTENSAEACEKMKEMCEDVKKILAGKHSEE